MSWRRLLLSLLLVASAATTRGDENWQKLRVNGAEAYYADLDLRAPFAEANLGNPAGEKLKVPTAKAPSFDWSGVLPKPHVLTQGVSINC